MQSKIAKRTDIMFSTNQNNPHNHFFKEITPFSIKALRAKLHKKLCTEFKKLPPDVIDFTIDTYIITKNNVNKIFNTIKGEINSQKISFTSDEIQSAFNIALEDYAKEFLNDKQYIKYLSDIILEVKLKHASRNIKL